MGALWLQNLAAHWVQAGVLALGAAALPTALRLRDPAVRLLFWQALFALCLALPFLQPWQPRLLVSAPAGPAVEVAVALLPVAAERFTLSPWPLLIVFMVAAGIVLRLGWIGLGLVRLRQLRRAPVLDAGSVAEIDRAMREIGVTPSVRLAGGDGPLNFGAIHPVIVLPASFLTVDCESRRAVALHELIHVRRRDWIVALVEEILLAVLWFHPWSWWIRAQIRLAREETVDREVVTRLGAREVYASCLLSIAGYDLTQFRPGVALLRPRELRHRLDALFREGTMSRVRFAATVALLGTVLAGLAVAAGFAFPLTTLASPERGVTQPGESRRILQLIPPEYPVAAQEDDVTGTVVVEVTVNAAGEVSGFNVIGGPPALHNPTITAVRQWRFERARTADVFVVELGYQLTVREGRRVPGWSFILRNRGAVAAVPTANGPLRVGGNIKPPRKIKDVRPIYPADAQAARVQGIVVIEVTIGADGRVTNTKVLRSIPELDQAAIDAVRQWEFEPVLMNGVATAVIMVATVNFTLA